jgi:hypothetical protein
MEPFYGEISSSIWLIGDSAPLKWIHNLKNPFDQKHPTVHNIWTPIIYRIQKNIFNEKAKFFDDEKTFYIRNAVYTDDQKPTQYSTNWSEYKELTNELEKMKKDIRINDPKMIITFGAFAFEFIRRCLEDTKLLHNYGYWKVKELGEIFREHIENKHIIIPLLHTSICRRYWSQNHIQFTDNESENYYNFVADKLYKRFIDILNI